MVIYKEMYHIGQKLYSRIEKSLPYLKHLPSRNPVVQRILNPTGKKFGGSKTQVRSQVRSLGRIFFCQGNWLYFWGIQKFGFIKRVDNVNWPPYRDFGGRTSYLLLGLYHASVKWTSIVFNANTPLPKRLVLCWVWLKRITRNIN